jgi:phosphoribosylformylglycinamidine cyclo-ligase
LGAEIDLGAWDRLPVFNWLISNAGLAQDEALKTFNCGIGMIAIVAADQIDAVMEAFETGGAEPVRIGRVIATEGVSYKGVL